MASSSSYHDDDESDMANVEPELGEDHTEVCFMNPYHKSFKVKVSGIQSRFNGIYVLPFSRASLYLVCNKHDV